MESALVIFSSSRASHIRTFRRRVCVFKFSHRVKKSSTSGLWLNMLNISDLIRRSFVWNDMVESARSTKSTPILLITNSIKLTCWFSAGLSGEPAYHEWIHSSDNQHTHVSCDQHAKHDMFWGPTAQIFSAGNIIIKHIIICTCNFTWLMMKAERKWGWLPCLETFR